MANYQEVRMFQGDVRKWIEATKDGLGDVVREFVNAVHAELVMTSPVDTGRFRANWQITGDKIPLFALNQYDKDGAASIAEGKRIAGALFPKGRGFAVTTVYFSNMLIYANSLEYGHSKQAPAGVLGIVAVKLRTFMADAVKESRKQNGL